MSTINQIQSTTLTVELKIREMQEAYNVLEEHRIKVSGKCINDMKEPEIDASKKDSSNSVMFSFLMSFEMSQKGKHIFFNLLMQK